MLIRKTANNGVVIYESPLLAAIGVPHAFSTRIGGVSPPPFDSLSLGNPAGCDVVDDSDHIAENGRRLLSAIGCADRTLARVHQVHGNDSVLVQRGRDVDPSTQADALICDDPARVISVRIADCVPILLSTDDGRCVAAIHAGWRGVIANVVGATLSRMSERVGHADFIAAIGPCIGIDAFEVGGEVADAFHRAFASDAPSLMRLGPSGKPRVDLRQAVRLQLLQSGIPDRRIDLTDRCTHRDADEFFSHRRDNGITGRMTGLIGCRLFHRLHEAT